MFLNVQSKTGLWTDDLFPEDSKFQPGIQIYPGSCNATGEHEIVETSLTHARLFARAGLQAVRERSTGLFDVFFYPDDAEKVQAAFQNVTDILLNKSTFPAVISCLGNERLCAEHPFAAYIYWNTEYAHSESILPIDLCMNELSKYPLLPDPCEKASLEFLNTASGVYKASVFLHELLHTDHVTGLNSEPLYDGVQDTYGAIALRNGRLHLERSDLNRTLLPVDNIESYVILAHLAWIRHTQLRRCAHFAPLWNFVEAVNARPVSGLNQTLPLGNESYDSAIMLLSNQTDVVQCDDSCRNLQVSSCSRSPSGTLPSSGCYPPLAITTNQGSRASQP